MKTKFLLILLIAVSSTPNINAQDNWIIDPSHSSVNFAVGHLVVSEVTGSFNRFSGNMTMTNDDFTTANLKGEIEANSVDTKNTQRDGHLQAHDFFDAAKYPKISFTSTTINKVKPNTYLMKGNLTIKNVTKLIELQVIYKGTANFMGQTKSGIKATGLINRKDFGLSYNSLLESGGAVVGKEVSFTLNFEIVKR